MQEIVLVKILGLNLGFYCCEHIYPHCLVLFVVVEGVEVVIKDLCNGVMLDFIQIGMNLALVTCLYVKGKEEPKKVLLIIEHELSFVVLDFSQVVFVI